MNDSQKPANPPARLIRCAIVGAACIAMTHAQIVQAGFVDERKEVTLPAAHAKPASSASGLQVVTGAAPLPTNGEWAEPARGFGKNVSVMDALTSVLPPGVKLQMVSDPPAKPVSWRGGVSRSAAISKILLDSGMHAHLADSGRELVVEAGPEGTDPITTEVVGKSDGPVRVSAVPAAKSSIAALPAYQGGEVRTWHLQRGRPIGAQLKEWASRVGWTVSWEYPSKSDPKDIDSSADMTYTGDFVTVAGRIIATLNANGALIYAHFYEQTRTERVYTVGNNINTDSEQ